jgi:CHRD domain/PEP-CTERM motif
MCQILEFAAQSDKLNGWCKYNIWLAAQRRTRPAQVVVVSAKELPLMSRSLIVGMFALFAMAGSAFAHEEILFADATNEAENPDALPLLTASGAPRPKSFGTASFVLNDLQTQMTMTATIFNIDVTGTQTPNDTNDNLTLAHIHGGAGVTPTTNGGVVWGFFGAPFNDNNPNDAVMTPFATGVGGTFTGKWDLPEGNNTTLTAQLDNILNGRTYINFHTNQYGGGEIRGNLVVVPEPSSVALVCMVGASLMGVCWRRRRAMGR